MSVETRESGVGVFGLAWLLAVVLLGFSARVACAQSTISVRSGFNQEVCYLGDEVVFEVTVTNSDSVDPPDLSGVPGGRFSFSGTSNESRTIVSIVNGRRREEASKRLVMRWVVTPTELGTLIVPPVLVRVDQGQLVETEEARIRVLEPERETRDVVQLTADSATLYLNQPTRVSVSWVLAGKVGEYSFRASKADEGLMIQPLQKPRRGNEQRYRVDIFDGEGLATLGFATLEGRRTQAFQFDLLVTPTKPGRLTLGPIVVTFDEQVNRSSSRRVVAQSAPIEFEVKTLPTEGQPTNFSGLLGPHDIEVRADQDSVGVGDPIGLEVTIYGPEPMTNVQDGPDLSKIPAFAEGFRMASEGWSFVGGGQPGERTFSTTIRVADPGVTEIPSIPLPFYDMDAEAYRIARSQAIPIEVRAVREVTAADAVVSSGAGAGGAAISREPLTRTAAGVWGIDRGAAVLAQGDPFSGEGWRSPVLIGAGVVPPIVFAVVGLVVWRRRSAVDARAIRRVRALSRARRVLRREGASAAIRGYVADVFDASPAAMTGADGDRMLRDAGVSDAAPLIELLAMHEARSYGSARDDLPGDGDPIDAGRVVSLLRRVDRQVVREADRGERSRDRTGAESAASAPLVGGVS